MTQATLDGFIKLHSIILVFYNILLIVGMGGSISCDPNEAKDSKLNIVIILSDDMVINSRAEY